MAQTTNVRKWAVVGAALRLREAQAEIAEIYRAFPQLRTKGARTTKSSGAGSGKRQFSAEGKAAISEGMRKYWAKRKAAAARAARSAD